MSKLTEINFRIELAKMVINLLNNDPYFDDKDQQQRQKALENYQLQLQVLEKKKDKIQRSKGGVVVGLKPARLTAEAVKPGS